VLHLNNSHPSSHLNGVDNGQRCELVSEIIIIMGVRDTIAFQSPSHCIGAMEGR
jgi:hypothetical protein